MADVITISLVTLPVGETDTPSITVADTDTTIDVRIDRTVTNGFNSQPTTTQLWMYPFQSNDGGATWTELGGGLASGGVFTNRSGQVAAYGDIQTSLLPGTGRKVMAKLIVSGAAVAVQGTVTSS